jgi:hypothetical protein
MTSLILGLTYERDKLHPRAIAKRKNRYFQVIMSRGVDVAS